MKMKVRRRRKVMIYLLVWEREEGQDCKTHE